MADSMADFDKNNSRPDADGRDGQRYGSTYGGAGERVEVPAPSSGTSTARTWALGAHLSGPLGALLSFGALMVVGPLVVMLTEGTKDAWVRRNAVEALNFAITGLIAMALGYLLMLVTFGFLFFVPFVVGAVYVVLGVVAGLQAYKGEDYRYPATLRLVK